MAKVKVLENTLKKFGKEVIHWPSVDPRGQTYIKFENGLLLCFNWANLQGYNEGNPLRINFPVNYKVKPIVLTSMTRNASSGSAMIIIDDRNSSTSSFFVYHSSSDGLGIGVNWLSIGFWK